MTRATTFGVPQFKTWSISARIGYFTGPREPNGCRNWTSGLTSIGYAKFRLNGKSYSVARTIVGLASGDRRVVMHSCDNRACVEPSHLSIGTHQENLLDMHRKGRHPRNTSHCVRGHLFDEENTRRERNGSRLQRACRACGRLRYAERKLAKVKP